MSLDKLIAKAQSRNSPMLFENSTAATITLMDIQYRQQDTRPLNQPHVAALAESIAVVGLIEPLAVDLKGRLLAGSHRLAAIQWLKTNQSAAYAAQFPDDQVLVRRFDFNADEDPQRALAIEVTENEKRRDYSPSEVKTLAERLKAAGYREKPGKPRKGQRALMPALETIVGKSARQLHRYLSNEQSLPQDELNIKTDVRILQQMLKRIEKLEKSPKIENDAKELWNQLSPMKTLILKTINDWSREL
jgi:ParB family chromosome partitioning protein